MCANILHMIPVPTKTWSERLLLYKRPRGNSRIGGRSRLFGRKMNCASLSARARARPSVRPSVCHIPTNRPESKIKWPQPTDGCRVDEGRIWREAGAAAAAVGTSVKSCEENISCCARPLRASYLHITSVKMTAEGGLCRLGHHVPHQPPL